jgi:hypothetical protein
MNEKVAGLSECSDDVIVFDGLERAFIGYAERFGFANSVAVYDRGITINILMQGGMNRNAAEDYFQSSVIGSWLGEGTPIFVSIEPFSEH